MCPLVFRHRGVRRVLPTGLEPAQTGFVDQALIPFGYGNATLTGFEPVPPTVTG